MNVFINKKIRCGVLVVMSVLLAVVLMSCPEAAAGDGSSDSGPVNSPVTSVTLHFTNDYKMEDKLKISFPAGTVSNSFTQNGDILSVPQSDVSYSKSGNTHNVILKVRPYYGSDNLTNVANGTGTVKVTPELASSASSSIPANNELAITNNVISFTGTHDGATHTYTITLERQDTKVTVNILDVGINLLYVDAPTNAVNLFVNMFVHDSKDEVATNTANGYVSRTTAIRSHGQQSSAELFTMRGKYAYDTTTPNDEASLPAFMMRSATTYYLHVYYKDVHTGTEKKDVHAFTTKALPTAADRDLTGGADPPPKDFAHTWASENGGYKLNSWLPAAATTGYQLSFFSGSELTTRNSTVSDLKTSFDAERAKINNYNNNSGVKTVSSRVVLGKERKSVAFLYDGTVQESCQKTTTQLFCDAQSPKYFEKNLDTDKYLLYIYRQQTDLPDNILTIHGFRLDTTILESKFVISTSSKSSWMGTSLTDATPIRPITQ